MHVLGDLRDHISGLKATKLKELIIDQLYNPAVMKGAMCAIDSVFYTSPYDMGSLYFNNRIRMYIHNLHQIGGESVEGYALSADFENTKDMFIVKVSRSPVDDSLLHELIVGLYGTNKLREYIPNFAYIFGGFKCSPPLIDPKTKKVVTWCLHNDNPVNYVIYENIAPSISMAKYLETCSGVQFVNTYLQILYALRLALKLIDYTHYDLHYENVLMRIISDKDFQIPYETENGIEYITTRVIPTIIDYGFSHIRTNDLIDNDDNIIIKGHHYGKNRFIPFSVFSYRSWIMHDLYKLLMFSILAALRSKNNSVYTEAYKIFRFFNKLEDPTSAIQQESFLSFSFPLNDYTNNFTIDNLALHIKSVCECDFISKVRSTDPILNCEKMCLTEGEFLNEIGLNSAIGVPDNIIEFYDIMVRLQNEGREIEKDTIARAFPYQRRMNEHINKTKELIRDLIEVRSKLKLVNVGDMTLDQVLNYNTMTIVRSMYISIAAIIDMTVNLRFYYEIGISVAESYDDGNTINILNNIMTQFDTKVRPSLEEAKRILANNDEYLNQIQNDIAVRGFITNDDRLNWYWNGRKLFDIAFGRINVTL